MDDEKLVLDEKDIHCIARMMQGYIYNPDNNPFYGCKYCKYVDECFIGETDTNGKKHLIKGADNVVRLRDKLYRKTGLYLGLMMVGREEDVDKIFQYHRTDNPISEIARKDRYANHEEP